MARIHQLQVTYAPAQDRLLFRISIVRRQLAEFRFWFTRRYVRILWRAILDILKKEAEGKGQEGGPMAGPAQALAMQAEHQEAISKADFKTPFEESAVFPLGEEPILAGKLAVKAGPKGGRILSIQPMEGEGIEFGLDRQTMHSFCRLIVRATEKAEWDLKLDFEQAEGLMDQGGLN